MTGREHRQRRKRFATTAATDAAVDRKWKILMALSFAIFSYLVLITQVVLEVSTHSDQYDNASMHDRGSFLKLQQEYSGSRRRNITAIIAELADVPDDKVKATTTTTTAVVNNTDTSTNKYNDDIGQEDKNVGGNNNTEQEEVYIPRKGQQVTSKQKALKKKRREAKRQQKLMANNNNNDNVTIDMSKWTYEETAIKPNISNDEYYKNIPLEFLTTDDTYYLWDKDKIVPEWMKDYFRWHRYKRSTWGDLSQNESWKQERWLIMQCLLVQDKRKCGGTADRLKPIPALLKKAYDTKRILLIRWTRPTMLEEFLIPPEGGFDWRVPLIMADVMDDDSNGKRLVTKATIAAYAEGGMALVKCRWQTTTPSYIYDSEIFGFTDDSNKTLNITDTSFEPNFETVFAHVWKIFFTPSPPVASKIQSKLDAMDLQPNHYVASHFRALYGVAERPEKEIEQYTANALACATHIRPNVPIFFASDSSHATERALQYNNKEVGSPSHHIRVVTSIPNPNPPWHLDSYVSGPTEKFYDTFIDLYLLALGGCVTYSNGGYGHWGLLIGGNVECNIRQLFIGRKSNNKKDFCKWSSSDSKTKEVATTVYGNDSGPLFLPPMK